MTLCIASSGNFFSNYGGGQVYVRNIVDELSKRTDIQLFIVSRCPKNSTAEYQGIEVYEYADADSLHEILTTKKPDVVHANGDKLTVAKVCKSLGTPCVITAHHGGIVCPAGALLNTSDEICRIPANYKSCIKCYLRNTPTGLFWYPLLRHFSQKKYVSIGNLLNKLPFIPFLSPIGKTGLIVSLKLKEWQELSETATHFIAPSYAIAEALKRNGCRESKISVIPHGIPIHQTSNIKHQTLNINYYYVGRINYVKGIHVLLKAFSTTNNPNIQLHLIGGAGNKPEMRYMRRLQCKYRKDKRIIWHGKLPINELNEIIKDFHCLIHPAIYLEVFGLNISEALSQHKYVIATRCGGAEMQIHSEKDGILVEPNNVEQLASAMKNYCLNHKSSACQIKNIREHVEDLRSLYTRIICSS